MSVLWKSIMTAELSWSVLMIILFTLKRFDLINTPDDVVWMDMWSNILSVYFSPKNGIVTDYILAYGSCAHSKGCSQN